MVQAAGFRKLYDPARGGELDRPEVWSVLVKREMGTRSMVVHEVAGQNASQMPLAENDDMVQALASHRADELLGERILPRAVRRREDFLDPQARHSVPKLLAVNLVTIAQEIGRCGIVGEGV